MTPTLTTPGRGVKPTKPTPDFPLFPHDSGKWAKKIDGQMRYFGRWPDPIGALAEYKDFITTRTAKVTPGVLTVKSAVNQFLHFKERARDRGEIASKTWTEYRDTCQRFASHAGYDTPVQALGPACFQSYRHDRAESYGPIRLGNEVTRIKVLFKWLKESRLIRELPDYGPDFRKPSQKVIRRHRRQQGKKLFAPDEILRFLDESGLQLRAMILLGINCGFGNNDCAQLTLDALDLDRAWVHFPRPKTEVERDCPLWPETVTALRSWLARRPRSAVTVTVFMLPDGRPWSVNNSEAVAKHFRQVRIWAGSKKGGFYWLRHTFQTVAGESKDQVAVGALMGHVDASISAVYREEISEKRLKAVSDHVRAWLFGSALTQSPRRHKREKS